MNLRRVVSRLEGNQMDVEVAETTGVSQIAFLGLGTVFLETGNAG